ncbi:5-formyltetrahydrofolate cyclo-ligase [Bacteroidia bacterium]|nr:5-formyltetrahydrofolate cyclo-ligase [Bacteroidia bacterium]
MDKQTIRSDIRKAMRQISEAEKGSRSALLWQTLESRDIFRQSATVLMYWSMPDEVFTHEAVLRWCASKTILLPVITGDFLTIAPFNGIPALRKNARLNVYEPQGTAYTDWQTIDLVIVPGVAFDRECHRLGRGKGYYDRLLPSLSAYKAGVCFDFQILDNIPREPHDVLMDEVIGC